ncbi:MAG TPA: DoxX family protein [Rubricoccaceae bacterium]
MNSRRLLFGTPGPARNLDAGLLVLRLGLFGLLAFGHGLGKLPVSPEFVQGTADMGFPLPVLFAWAAALSEFAGGLLLAFGFLTRPAAVIVATTMFVAFGLAHGFALSGESSGEMAFLYLVGALALFFTGPGRYSVDAILNRSEISY